MNTKQNDGVQRFYHREAQYLLNKAMAAATLAGDEDFAERIAGLAAEAQRKGGPPEWDRTADRAQQGTLE